MARQLDPISLAMLDYVRAVDQVFGLSTSVQPNNENEGN